MVNKLKSNRGATMILALALFLICVMVSSIILVVAASSSGRVSQQVEEQQAYLAVSSAADIVATELNRCNKYILENGVELVGETDLTGVFAELVNKAAFSVFMMNTEYTDTIKMAMTVPDDRLSDAECSFKMGTDYNIEIIIKTADSNYSIVVRSKATVNDLDETIDLDGDGNPDTDDEGNIKVTTTKTITWGTPDVTKGVGN